MIPRRQLFRLFHFGIGASTHLAALVYYEQNTLGRRLRQVHNLLTSRGRTHRASIARLRSRRREIDLAEGKKRELFSPQSAGLPPREGVRGGPQLPSHSTRPGPPPSSAVVLPSRGRGGSVSSSE